MTILKFAMIQLTTNDLILKYIEIHLRYIYQF